MNVINTKHSLLSCHQEINSQSSDPFLSLWGNRPKPTLYAELLSASSFIPELCLGSESDNGGNVVGGAGLLKITLSLP